MTVLDLFSGIGGFSLGLETAGMQTVAFCELDPWARRVIRKHWPDVPIFEDVIELKGADIGSVDLVCGGFPCQDISVAGQGAGLAGERSSLWWQMHRLIADLQPRWVFVENVSALRTRGADEVLGSLEGLGYTCWPLVVGADDVGAPHRRKRVWIVAATKRGGWDTRCEHTTMADPQEQHGAKRRRSAPLPRWGRPDAADATGPNGPGDVGDSLFLGLPDGLPAGLHGGQGAAGPAGEAAPGSGCTRWATEPDVGRMAHGIPSRVDRLRGLGNAVVPQIPELIGRAILRVDGFYQGLPTATSRQTGVSHA